jgi:hypothetical protein
VAPRLRLAARRTDARLPLGVARRARRGWPPWPSTAPRLRHGALADDARPVRGRPCRAALQVPGPSPSTSSARRGTRCWPAISCRPRAWSHRPGRAPVPARGQGRRRHRVHAGRCERGLRRPPLQRCFRDIHTAGQHVAFGPDGLKGWAQDHFATAWPRPDRSGTDLRASAAGLGMSAPGPRLLVSRGTGGRRVGGAAGAKLAERRRGPPRPDARDLTAEGRVGEVQSRSSALRSCFGSAVGRVEPLLLHRRSGSY